MATQCAIGAISGTSMDGIDVAMVETDGKSDVRPGAGRVYVYDKPLGEALRALIANPERAAREPLTELEEAVGDAHADAVNRFIEEEGLDRGSIALVGLHGQTVFHRPEIRVTRQLGLGQRCADRIGINVVNRFRHADVAAGGHGAPFVPIYHQALAASLPKEYRTGPLMVLNLGGVANVTYLWTGDPIAFDTGPASALIDDFMLRRMGRPFDEGGRLAAAGVVDEAVRGMLMDNPFFAVRPPKSLDRQDFHQRAKCVEGLPDADAAATLAAFTVASVAASLAHVPQEPARWLVTGGGRLNAALMDGLCAVLGVPVEPVETVGWDGDFLEAQCFAYLAVRSRLGLPLSLPSTTGAPRPMPGGEFWSPR